MKYGRFQILFKLWDQDSTRGAVQKGTVVTRGAVQKGTVSVVMRGNSSAKHVYI